MLIFPNPILDPISGYLIQLQHHRLVIEHDFELTQEIRQVYFTNNDGEFGVPLLDAISLDPNLTPEQKLRQTKSFQPQLRTVSTRGFKVDPATGKIVELGENGLYPEGSVDEKLIWLSVLASEIPGESLSDKVKALMLQSMGKMVDRGRI